MNFQSILIITYGRSGSTLLQGLLNSIDNCTIRGENYNFCYGLFQAYQALQQASQEACVQKGKEGSPTSPFFGAGLLNEERFIKDARSMVRHQLLPNEAANKTRNSQHCIGFKEIRYLLPNIAPYELVPYLEFLSHIFPKPAFIILTREKKQVIHSAWWQSMNPETVTHKLELFEKEINNKTTNPKRTFHLDYSDMVNRTFQLEEMFRFLGAEYDEDKINEIMATPHSYTPKQGTIKAYKKNKDMLPQEVLFFFIDDDVANPVGNTLFTLRGVLVLRGGNHIQGYKMVATDLTGEHEVEWGLRSPLIAQQYPDIKGVELSRFRVNNMCVTKNHQVELFLVDSNGVQLKLAQIESFA